MISKAEAQDRKRIKAILRKAWMMSNARKNWLKNHRIVKINPLTRRKHYHYICNKCNISLPYSGIQVDHIIPIFEGVLKDTDLDLWIADIAGRIFNTSNLQILCEECHASKTMMETFK